MNKVLILSCGTGGGHNSAAKAIQEALLKKGVQADFLEYLDIIGPNIKEKVNNLYLKSTKGEGKIFKNIYHLGELYEKIKLKSPVYGLNTLIKKRLYKYIIENKYDYVIATHLFAAEGLTALKKEHDICFMAIATDYVCIPFWKETNPDYFVIPHKDLKNSFIDAGVDSKKLLPIGIPVELKYSLKYNKLDCKREIGLKQNEKYVLILNGSMGFGNVNEMLEKLILEIDDVNFIVSCGNNKKLLDDLNKKYKKNCRIIILEYTNYLNKYMACSEIILTKPGGLTTTEIATMRKPLIHTMPIPGCENYNAAFFADRKMSIKCENIEEVVSATKKLLYNKEIQNEIINNQMKYIKIDTNMQIADVIINEIEKGKNYERICKYRK